MRAVGVGARGTHLLIPMPMPNKHLTTRSHQKTSVVAPSSAATVHSAPAASSGTRRPSASFIHELVEAYKARAQAVRPGGAQALRT